MVTHLLNRSMQVWRPTATADAGGGQDETLAHLDTVPVRLSRPTDREREISQQERGWVDYDVYLAPDTIVARRDELRDDELTLKVLATMQPSEPIYTRARCEQQQPS